MYANILENTKITIWVCTKITSFTKVSISACQSKNPKKIMDVETDINYFFWKMKQYFSTPPKNVFSVSKIQKK